jgi:two-component system KDP operon response regulator KdpE
VLTVLVIDDEPQIRRLIRNALATEMRVIEAATGREGIDLAAAESPALIILDLGLPDMPGIEVCREVRQWSTARILALTTQPTDAEKAAVLDAGADDYMTRQTSASELRVRVREQLRRARSGASALHDVAVQLGTLTIDMQQHRVERDGESIHLTPTEWALLRTLVAHPRQTLTHQQLFNAVWGDVSGNAQQYLRVYVGHLRRKIEVDPLQPRLILTEPSVGYRFEAEPKPAAYDGESSARP